MTTAQFAIVSALMNVLWNDIMVCVNVHNTFIVLEYTNETLTANGKVIEFDGITILAVANDILSTI
jgi:hypothetical protein